jgi:PAS domain S-box-containing protein
VEALMTAKININKPGVTAAAGCPKNGENAYLSDQEIINSFFDNANDLIHSVRADGTIVYANKKWLDTLGYEKKELPCLNIYNILKEDQIPHCFQILERIKNGEKFEFIETIFKTKDGRDIWVEGNVNGYFEDGNFIASRGIFRDISRRKALEETYASLTRNLPVSIYILQNGIIHYVNPNFLSITHYKESDLIGSEFLNLVVPEDRARIQNTLNLFSANTDTINYEYRLVNKYGDVRWVMDTLISIPYEGGRAVLGTFMDITERKSVECALDEANNNYKTLFNSAGDAIYITNLQNQLLEVNDAACKLFGYTKTELQKKDLIELVSPGFTQNFDQAIKELIEKGDIVCEAEILNKNGNIIPIGLHSRIIDYQGKKAILVIFRDISERKKFEEELKKTRDKFLKTFQLNPAMMTIVSMVDSRYINVNKAFETETGYSAAEIIGSSSKDSRLFRDHEIMSQVENLLHEQGFVKNVEIPFTVKSGETCTGSISMEIIEMDGESAAISVIENISERKKILEQITNEKNKLQSITDSLGDGLNIVDLDYNIIYQNGSSISNMGQHLGEKCYRVFTNSPEECDICPVRMALGDGKKHVVETNVTFPDGKNLISEITASCIRDANGKITSFIELVRDITDRRQAEIKLIESEEFNSTLLRNSPSPILVINPDSSIKYLNPALIQLTGFKEDEIIGLKTPYPWYPEENRLQYSSEILKALNQGVIRAERQYQKMDGERFWVQVSATTVQSKGKANYTIATWNDITENKKMEESLRVSESNFRNLIENAPLGISVGTIKGTIIIANKTMFDAYGCETELEFKIKPINERYANLVDRERFLNQLLKEGLVKNFEVPMKRKNGEIFWASTNAIYQKFGHTDCIITIVEDITERKLAKDNLEKVNKQLIELDKLKDNFLSTVSHELRTPLTSIKSFAEILLNYDEDRATQKEFLGIINEESDRLSRLINDFLDLSKIQAGRMQWQTADIALPEVLQTAKNTLKPLLEKNQLELTVDLEPDLPLVRSDKDKLLQVFTNLLGNAIKFTPEGGKITVKARLQNASENTENKEVVEVKITDTGIGIAPEHYLSIFEKFGQVGDVLKDRPKGTGLGLPICKKIIENYGGKIWVESVLGKGSSFIFTLNIAPSSKINTSVPQTQGFRISLSTIETKKSKTVLVVDDELNIRRFIKHELSNRGHDVIEASGGKEAVDLARKFHPDLITLDITMPDINGFDVTAVLKNDPQTKDIPILIISVIEDKQKAYRLGANDYITKPISIDLLMKRVDYLLESKQKKVLAVDDEAAITRSLEFELLKRGYTVYTAANGKEGLISVQENHPSLIILDLKMPLMDGYQMLKELKNKPDTQGIPVILLTGVEIDGGRVKALSIGASDYVKKSEGFNKLFEAVERIAGG